MKKKLIYNLFGISIVFSLFSVLTVEATIMNSISVSSNSGGNTANNGAVVEGKNTSSVDIVTIVNGEIIEDIHETSTSSSIYIENTTISSNGESTSTTNIFRDDEVQDAHLNTNEVKDQTTNIISNINEEVDEKVYNNVFARQIRLFTTLFINFSRTINHVLSNII